LVERVLTSFSDALSGARLRRFLPLLWEIAKTMELAMVPATNDDPAIGDIPNSCSSRSATKAAETAAVQSAAR